MKVQKSYYDDEVRDGFYVPGIMKRAWAASVEVLEEIERICNKYDIEYFADAGTLLGAVRHKGMIPWDDDIDVCLKREEYNRFVKIAQKEFENSKQFKILNIHTDKAYDQVFSRVVTGYNIKFNKDYLEKFHDFPFVVGIDVFPLDYVPDNEEEDNLRCEIIELVGSTATNIKELYEEVEESDLLTEEDISELINQMIKSIEELCNISIDRNGDIYNQLFLLMERMMCLYSADESKKLALMPVWVSQKGNLFNKEYYNNRVYLEYENFKVPVPAMYDSILREKYGDYMKMVHNWDFHDYPFYGGQVEFFEKETGISYPKYSFTIDDLVRVREFKNGITVNKLIKGKTIESLRIMRQLHREIKASDNVEEVFDSLQYCQDTAVTAGNLLETYKSDTILIKELENYCENVYQLYMDISNTYENGTWKEQSEKANDLDVIIKNIEDELENELDIKREVLFITYKSDWWKCFAPIWKKEKSTENTDVYVMVIPYYYKNALLEVKSQEWEGDNYPDTVTITLPGDYDIPSRQPDTIYIQSPYDEYNLIHTTEREYFSSELKKHTDNLVYIPWFTQDEIDPKDMRAYHNMQYYISMPGVVNADRVLVQSEHMKKTYVDYLTDMAGEETRSIWNDKLEDIENSEFAKYLQVEHEEVDIPKEWNRISVNNSGKKRKIICYDTSIGDLYEYREQYITKITNSLELFRKKSSEIGVILNANFSEENMLFGEHRDLCEEFFKVLSSYEGEEWIIINRQDNDDAMLAFCDACYGDRGRLLNRFSANKKPAMIQNVEML